MLTVAIYVRRTVIFFWDVSIQSIISRAGASEMNLKVKVVSKNECYGVSGDYIVMNMSSCKNLHLYIYTCKYIGI